jgi:hypothetical protein
MKSEMNNVLCHIEIEVTDLAKAQAFYQGLFGWRFSAFTDDMVVFGNGDEHIGGLMKKDSVNAGTSPSLWFKVADIDASVTQAVALGGAVLSEKTELPQVGWSALVADLDGNGVGLVQYREQA